MDFIFDYNLQILFAKVYVYLYDYYCKVPIFFIHHYASPMHRAVAIE